MKDPILLCCSPHNNSFRIKCFTEGAPALVLDKSRKHLDKWSSMSSLTQDLHSPFAPLKQTPDSCEASHPCRAALEVTGLPARKNGDSMRTKLSQSGGDPASLFGWRRVLWPISVLLVSGEQEALSYVSSWEVCDWIFSSSLPVASSFPLRKDTLCVQTSLEEQRACCFLEKEKPWKGVGGLVRQHPPARNV